MPGTLCVLDLGVRLKSSNRSFAVSRVFPSSTIFQDVIAGFSLSDALHVCSSQISRRVTVFIHHREAKGVRTSHSHRGERSDAQERRRPANNTRMDNPRPALSLGRSWCFGSWISFHLRCRSVLPSQGCSPEIDPLAAARHTVPSVSFPRSCIRSHSGVHRARPASA